jgi:(1->4)-alpha-D-glucan 1-alpha-D-glucosylmutase
VSTEALPAGAALQATYRLQLTDQFGFAAAGRLIPYLRDLGISHLYLSPSLQARPGSTHGYDVINPAQLSLDLGGAEEFERLCADAHDAGMGILLDVVPNHMATDPANRFWADQALRRRFFDIDPVNGAHRRFFDIDDLAGVRQEDPEVFQRTHELVLSLVQRGLVDGLRVDHPDGLADPAGYLRRLREAGARRVWVEKILDPDESLRDWPVSGTVGYEFLNDACALFVDPAGEEPLTKLWEEISGERRSFGEAAFAAKLEQATTTFAPEVERLGREDPTVDVRSLPSALASLPVYRTYVDPVDRVVSDEDRRALDTVDPEIRDRVLLEHDCPPAFVTRFQQTTPAIMAKGVEDTAFYRYGRLLALNDVGGDPSRFGIAVERFHSGCRERAERFPEALLTTMTHDAKRSGDVRMRIAAVAAMPDEWRAQVERWLELTEPLRSDGAPDDAERYFIFQTLAGAWPLEAGRLETYMQKALREAKRHTSWVEQNTDYEQAVLAFCRSLYSSEAFLHEFEQFVPRLAEAGDAYALRQLVLKLTAPGVPDIYQGDELPYRALVDPDNRRPVDWGWQQAMLRRVMGGSPPTAHTRKLLITMRLLGLRARRPRALALGGYEPLDAGPAGCVFARGGEVLVAVTLPRTGAPEALALELPGGRWRDVLRGEERSFQGRQPLSRLVDRHGVGVFERIGA